MMEYMDAVNAMIKGSKCARQVRNGTYLCILPGQNHIWIISKDTPNFTNATIYSPTINDMLALDWIIIP